MAAGPTEGSHLNEKKREKKHSVYEALGWHQWAKNRAWFAQTAAPPNLTNSAMDVSTGG